MRIQSLSDQAVRMTIPDGTSQNTMKNRILRVAAELGIAVTIRRVPGGLLFGVAAALRPKPTVRLPVRKMLSRPRAFSGKCALIAAHMGRIDTAPYLVSRASFLGKSLSISVSI
jgi:hypothetical protein